MGAPFPPVPNVVTVSLQGTSTNDVWENSVHFQYSGPPPSASVLNTVATNTFNGWTATMAPEVVGTIALTQVSVLDLSSNTAAQGIATGTQGGTRGDDPIPQNAAFLISYPSSLRFRGGHFRNYLLVGGVADMDGYNWHAAFVTEVKTHWDNFLTSFLNFSTGGFTPTNQVGLKRHGKFAPNGGPPGYVLTTPVIVTLPHGSSVPHAQIASQKGRINRRSR